MPVVREYLEDKVQWWLATIEQVPDAAKAPLRAAGQALYGHLQRLREPMIELVEPLRAKLEPFEPAQERYFVERAVADLAALATELDADDSPDEDFENREVEAFYSVLDGLVLGADSQDESVREVGRRLFNQAVSEVSVFSVAGIHADAYDQAYAPGTDWPRLFCRMVADHAEAMADPATRDFEDVRGLVAVQPLSWYVARWQPQESPMALAARTPREGRPLSVEDLQILLEKSPWWYVPRTGRCLKLSVTIGLRPLLQIEVFSEFDGDGERDRGLDGWQVQLRSAGKGPVTIQDGQARLELPDSIPVTTFRLEFLDPRAAQSQWIECLKATLR